MNELTKALYEAHVQHELAHWQGDVLPALLAPTLSAVYRWLGDVTLDEIATRIQIMGVIDRCVIEMQISGGITELAGEMSRVVLSSQATTTTRLDQLLHDDLYEDFATKVAALEGVRGALIGLLAKSEAFGALSARVVARAVTALVSRYVLAGTPGARLQRLFPGLERRMAQTLTGIVERAQLGAESAREALLVEALDAEWVRSVADDLWTALARKPLAEIFASIDNQDLEDFVVLCREFWLRYRKLDFFRELLAAMVDHFFDKYGPQTVQALITDMGVSEGMISTELEALLVPLVTQAARTGLVEEMVRLHLEPFYRSDALRDVLSAR